MERQVSSLRSIGYLLSQSTVANHVLLFTRMDALLLGVLCAWGMRDERVRDWITKHKRLLYASLIILVLITLIFIRKGWGVGTPEMSTIGFSVLALLYTTFLLLALTGGPIGWLTSLSPLRRLGIWAYFLYLAHNLTAHYTFQLFGRAERLRDFADWGVLLLSIIFLFLMAHLSWVYFEKPLLQTGHRWKYRRLLTHHRPVGS